MPTFVYVSVPFLIDRADLPESLKRLRDVPLYGAFGSVESFLQGLYYILFGRIALQASEDRAERLVAFDEP